MAKDEPTGTGVHDDIIRGRFAAMTDDDLRRAVSVERDDYVPRALELAEEELARRGAIEAPPSALDATKEPVVSKPPGLVWADLYGALLGMSAVGNPVPSVLNHAPWNAIAVQIIVGCCTAPVAYGLRKRRYWAWLLNWLFIIWIAFTFVVRSPGISGLVVAGGVVDSQWSLLCRAEVIVCSIPPIARASVSRCGLLFDPATRPRQSAPLCSAPRGRCLAIAWSCGPPA